jgi:predicted enzyme related to lactoylglutathione lyase
MGAPKASVGNDLVMSSAAPSPRMRLRSVVFDCPDPDSLSSFYAALLGGRRRREDADWCEVHLDDPAMKLAFQRVDRYRSPGWPDGSPQQLHLDLTVIDLTAASARAVFLGAKAVGEPVEEDGGWYMVHEDPAGHPFCLVVEEAHGGTG